MVIDCARTNANRQVKPSYVVTLKQLATKATMPRSGERSYARQSVVNQF